eukprot:GHVU01040831.1.p1 GENE.GHVU01040831.1~~GHVU01040831.1.p1  ORF type:complete len:215 (+),score=10.49 GHVU01040831.1:763-1407(+)
MAEVLLRRGFSVACMDFTGHGKSGGVFSTFGWREKDDVAELVKELRERRNINEIVLWGESQGAAAAIMYTESDSAISCMVLDSPFPRLRETFTDLMFCSVWGISLLVVPGINVLFSIIGFVALEVVRCELLRVCGYDINDVNPCESLSKYETAVPGACVSGVRVHLPGGHDAGRTISRRRIRRRIDLYVRSTPVTGRSVGRRSPFRPGGCRMRE